jgi:type VI secretion system protein ImpG
MDPRLLRYYDDELRHLHEMGAEFVEERPKTAARLAMRGIEVEDPYVERLLEGAAFLAARIQLKLDAEFPRFTQRLLEMVYPHYLAPTPAMLMARLYPDLGDTNLAKGFVVPRGSLMHGDVPKNDATPCDFLTAQDVTLWPLEIVEARYFSYAPDLPLPTLPVTSPVKGGVRLRLKASAGLKLNEIALDHLRVYLSGADDIARMLYELVFGSALGVLLTPLQRPMTWHEFLPPRDLHRPGLVDEEALLPVTLRSFQGYRLLQEYFSFSPRFLFFEISGLSRRLRRASTDELELTLLFGRGEAMLEKVVDVSNFSLFCTPAINLFPKRADRIHVSDSSWEFHVVPDRTRPMDFEVYEVGAVTGYGVGAASEREFRPFYQAVAADAREREAYFTVRREPRLLSEKQAREGTRSRYIGTEVFISLVDPEEAPYGDDLRQLSVNTLCTNRDLALQMLPGVGKTDLTLDVAAPVTSIRAIKGPSRPRSPLAEGAVAWRFVSHLTLNYLSLLDNDPERGAAALREILELYAPAGDAEAKKQIGGIKSVRVRPLTRRLPGPGPIAFGRGLEITVEVEDLAFLGGSAFLLGTVLEQFFARHVSINSFTETVLRSAERGQIMRWVPRWGERPIL